jgi:hypothetical protein
VVSNILAQIVMVIGYTPLVVRLDQERQEMESVTMWLSICAASFTGLVAAWMKTDALGYIYAGRGALSSAIVVYLVMKIRLPNSPLFNRSASM